MRAKLVAPPALILLAGCGGGDRTGDVTDDRRDMVEALVDIGVVAADDPDGASCVATAVVDQYRDVRDGCGLGADATLESIADEIEG